MDFFKGMIIDYAIVGSVAYNAWISKKEGHIDIRIPLMTITNTGNSKY
jgi:hypothetical protein